MSMIKQTIKDNRKIRKHMVESFRGGSNDVNMHRVIDDLRDEILANVNEENKEMLDKNKKAEEQKKLSVLGSGHAE